MYVKWHLLCASLVFTFFCLSFGQKEERLCGDPKCRGAISEAKLVIKEFNGEGVSISQRDKVYIFSKPKENNSKSFYEVEVYDKNGKLKKSDGYAPISLLKETKVLIPKKNLVIVTRTKFPSDSEEKAKAEATANTVNNSNVINVSPPAASPVASSAIDVTSPVASTAVPSVQYVPGGVMAELGNGGQPPTPYEITDGTTLYQGIDGEVTILPTSTDPPSLSTEYPGTKTEPDVVPNATDEAAGSQGGQENAGEEEEEGDDDDDDDDDGEEEGEEEEADLIDDEDDSEEALVSESVDTDAAKPLEKSDAEDRTRTKRDVPNTVPEASGLMDDITRNIDMASRTEPGLNPEFDEELLKIRKARSQNQQVRPTVQVAQPVVAEPSVQQTTGHQEPPQQTEYYPPRVTEGTPEPKANEGSLKQPDITIPDQSNVAAVESVQAEGSGPPVLPNDKPEALATPPTESEVLSNTAQDGIPDIIADRTQQADLSVGIPATPNVTVGAADVQAKVSDTVNPILPEEQASETTPQKAPKSDFPTEPPASKVPVAKESPPLATTPAPEPDFPTEPPGSQVPVSEESPPLATTEAPSDTIIVNTVPPAENNNNRTKDQPSPDNVENSQELEKTLSFPGDDENLVQENIRNDLERVEIPASYVNQASDTGNEGDQAKVPNLDVGKVNEISHEIHHEYPTDQNVTIPAIDEQVPLEQDFGKSTENVYTESVPDTLPRPFPGQRPIYPGLIPTANKPEVIEEVISIGEGVGSVEQVTPPPEIKAEPEVTVPPPVQDVTSAEEESLGFSSFFSNWLGTSESDPIATEIPTPPVSSEPLPAVGIDGECKDLKGLETDCADAPGPPHLWHVFEKTVPETSYSLLYLIVTAVTLLVFTLGYYFIENSRQNAPLIKKINALTHDLQVATSQLDSRPVQESVGNSEILASIQEELAEVKKRNAALQLQVDALQNELDSSADAGMELNKMVTDLLAEKQSANALLMSVEHLQGQLDTQQKVIDDMNRSLLEKINENKALQGELATIQEKSESLEEEVTGLRESMGQLLKDKESSAWELEQKFDELEEQNRNLLADLSSLKEAKTAETDALSKSIAELKEQLSLKESEYSALQETVQDLKGAGTDASAIYDVGHVRAQLSRVLSEKETMQERLRDEEGARKLLEDHVKSVDEEVSRLRSAFESAEKEKVEAETKLVVLSNYWKEKETHFHKELGLQEVMWAQKQGEETTAYDRIKSLQDEVESYKSQTDMLKKEIVDQERGLKSQIATLEKKAHENWVAARQAERRLDESKQEAGQLRNMLTLIEKSTTADGNAVASPRVPGELNGDEGSLPPLLPDGTSPLPLPPLPIDPLAGPPPMLPPNFMPGMPPFMPPPMLPPPHLLSGDRRLPPLGRMSSPPPSRFSPGPGDYGYDRMSPSIHSPPVRNYRSPPTHRSSPWDEPPHRSGFRPVASHRDSRRDYQGSSSGHSSEESMEKHQPTRRGKV